MTSKERFITAMVNKKPDMVPVCPDLSQQMPLKMYGQPFWETYYYGNPPMWKVYLEALKYFKFDGRFIYGGVEFKTNSKVKKEKKIICKDENKMVKEKPMSKSQDTKKDAKKKPTKTLKEKRLEKASKKAGK